MDHVLSLAAVINLDESTAFYKINLRRPSQRSSPVIWRTVISMLLYRAVKNGARYSTVVAIYQLPLFVRKYRGSKIIALIITGPEARSR